MVDVEQQPKANGIHKVSKNAKRRAKKKAAPKESKQEQAGPSTSARGQSAGAEDADEEEAVIDVVAEPLPSFGTGDSASESDKDPFAAFADVFARFHSREQELLGIEANGPEDEGVGADGQPSKGQVIYSDEEDESDADASDTEGRKPLSKRKQRKMQRLTVAELKQLVAKPEVVEGVDVTANDPRLLVQLKSYRNTIPVPAHWSLKRDYLQNKRGIEKAPFQLPTYIADTGIATIKDALKEKETGQTLKSKTRERVQPKMGKVDIDYQKLHDAFFRFQTAPVMSRYGETYYEGKEYETKFRERRPGDLSDELKEALSIPPLAPPPWLIAMQRFGPPPNYPHLSIAGLNAPIPDGAQWGFHPGGWGRPPLDEQGNPIYAGVMGAQAPAAEAEEAEEEIVREPWGELEPEESDEEEPEEDDEDENEQRDEDEEQDGEREDDEEETVPTDGLQTPSGFATPSGMQSITSTIPGGLDTPGFIDLRKDSRTRGYEDAPHSVPSAPRELYQVVPERNTDLHGFMGSERGYDLAKLNAAGPTSGAPVLGSEERSRKRKQNDVSVSLDPAELENLSQAEIAERYEAARREASALRVPGASAGGDADVGAYREELSKKRREGEDRRRTGGRGERKEDKFNF